MQIGATMSISILYGKAFKESPLSTLLSEQGRAVATADVRYLTVNPVLPAAIGQIQISEVPRHTQMASMPAPDGA